MTEEEDNHKIIIGIDESARGTLVGRVYAAATILSTELQKQGITNIIKDSKKFHSKKKILDASEFIKKNVIAFSIKFEEADVIDEINIRRATFKAMHSCIRELIEKEKIENPHKTVEIHVDGNDFIPYMYFDKNTNSLNQIPYKTIIGGDNTNASIAAASVLAKTERDQYILELCKTRPELIERYGIDTNMGYGTKKHIEGIQKYGYTDLHRKSFHIKKIIIKTTETIL